LRKRESSAVQPRHQVRPAHRRNEPPSARTGVGNQPTSQESRQPEPARRSPNPSRKATAGIAARRDERSRLDASHAQRPRQGTVNARSHSRTTSQEREGEVPPEPPLDAQQRTTHHRAAKPTSSAPQNAPQQKRRCSQRSIPSALDITGPGGRGSTRATAGRTTNNNPPRDRQTPFIASKKRPGPRRRTTWCGTHQVADATAHAFFHECQALCRMARDGMSPHIRSMALPSVGLGRIPSTAFGNS
jgi:hypothetical protein